MLMMESILKTINSVNCANYLFDKFVSVSIWSPLSSLRVCAESTLPDDFTLSMMRFHFQVKQHIGSFNQTLYFYMHFPCRICYPIICYPAWTCKEYINTFLGYFPISQPNHYNIMMASICTDELYWASN